MKQGANLKIIALQKTDPRLESVLQAVKRIFKNGNSLDIDAIESTAKAIDYFSEKQQHKRLEALEIEMKKLQD
jgi:hypothetical protein